MLSSLSVTPVGLDDAIHICDCHYCDTTGFDRRTGFGSYGNCSSDNASGCEGGDRDGPGLATSTLARSNRTNGRVIGLLSPDRVNATIAKVWCCCCFFSIS